LNPSTSGQSVKFTATVSAVAPGSGTPTGSVNFFDGATNIGNGALSAGVATFTTGTLTVAAHSITAIYVGDTNFTTSTSSPALTQTVNNAGAQSFSLSAPSTTSVSVVAGQTSSPVSFTVAPQNGSTQTVNFSCSGLPVLATCLFQPGSVTLDGIHTSAPVSVMFGTTADTMAAPAGKFISPASWTRLQTFFVFALASLSVVLFWMRRPRIAWIASSSFLLFALLSLAGCMSSGSSTTTYNGTPPGTYSVTISGSSGSVGQSAPSTISVMVTLH
jgi:hypothetical protein